MIVDAILLGGGRGERFSSRNGQSLPKQFHTLEGKPVLIHALSNMLELGYLRQIIIVVPETSIPLTKDLLEQHGYLQHKTQIHVIAGGNRRQDSSRRALETIEELGPIPARVLIHDAARPFLSQGFLERIGTHLKDRSYGAWIPVVAAQDTLKRIENNIVVETVDRSSIYRVQTPQIFEYSVIRSLSAQSKELSGFEFTDDASLCEYYGIPVGTFEGDVRNIKLTYPFELDILRGLLVSQKERVSCGSELDSTYIA